MFDSDQKLPQTVEEQTFVLCLSVGQMSDNSNSDNIAYLRLHCNFYSIGIQFENFDSKLSFESR